MLRGGGGGGGEGGGGGRGEGEWIGERNDGGHEEKLGRFPAIGREGS